jgi:hypothetical protein
MLCVIPFKDGHVLRPEVYKSLAMQTEPLFIMPITRPPLQEDIDAGSRSNYLSQAVTRNIAAELVNKKHAGELSLWHCADVVLTMINAVELCVELMNKKKEIGAVYLNTNTVPIGVMEDTHHFELSSVVVRNLVFKDVRFQSFDANHCNCEPFSQDIDRLGLRVQYLSKETMGHKISRYDVSEL